MILSCGLALHAVFHIAWSGGAGAASKFAFVVLLDFLLLRLCSSRCRLSGCRRTFKRSPRPQHTLRCMLSAGGRPQLRAVQPVHQRYATCECLMCVPPIRLLPECVPPRSGRTLAPPARPTRCQPSSSRAAPLPDVALPSLRGIAGSGPSGQALGPCSAWPPAGVTLGVSPRPPRPRQRTTASRAARWGAGATRSDTGRLARLATASAGCPSGARASAERRPSGARASGAREVCERLAWAALHQKRRMWCEPCAQSRRVRRGAR